MKKETWLLVANSSKARFFKVEKMGSILEFQSLIHAESRLHNGDLVSDKPGRAFESVGPQRHAVEPLVTPKQHEFEIFAKEIAKFLEGERAKGKFDRLFIAASPNLLGLLRNALHPSTKKIISGEVDKDVTNMKPEEIVEIVPFHI